jgi:hypothetical protein
MSPTVLANLLRLEVLNVSLNSIDGQITGLFNNKSSLGMLSVLDISQNQVSGPIPGEFFAKESNRSNSLREVAMYSNCFTGSLPATICDCHELNTIILDAVSSASSCRKKFGVLKVSSRCTSVSILSTEPSLAACGRCLPCERSTYLATI